MVYKIQKIILIFIKSIINVLDTIGHAVAMYQ